MKSTAFCIVLVSLLFCTCNDVPETKIATLPRSQVVVLCDLSNSSIRHASPAEQKQQLDKLKAYVTHVPRWYDVQSVIKFFPVSPNLISHQMGPSIVYNIVNVGDEDAAREAVDSSAKQVRHSIDSLLPGVTNSCIILSVERAVSILREGARDNNAPVNNELVIISDMVESCATTGQKPVVMSLKEIDKLNKAIERLDALQPAFNTDRLDLHIRVLMNSPKMDGVLNLIQDAWMRWFEKIGVDKTRVEFFTSDPPYNEYNADLK